MTDERHEIPTHLNVEDRAFYGLSIRQVMYLSVGFSGAYGLWNGWLDAPPAVRLGLALVGLLLAAALAFIRPYGRGLEDWGFVALRYLALPKIAVWRPCLAEREAGRTADGEWAELALDLTWDKEGA